MQLQLKVEPQKKKLKKKLKKKVEPQNQCQSRFPVAPIITASDSLKKNMIKRFLNTNYKIPGAADTRNNHSSHLMETAHASTSI